MNSWQHITILHCSLFLFSSLLHACLSCFSSRKDQIFGQQDFIFNFFFFYFLLLLYYHLHHTSLQRLHCNSYLWHCMYISIGEDRLCT